MKFVWKCIYTYYIYRDLKKTFVNISAICSLDPVPRKYWKCTITLLFWNCIFQRTSYFTFIFIVWLSFFFNYITRITFTIIVNITYELTMKVLQSMSLINCSTSLMTKLSLPNLLSFLVLKNGCIYLNRYYFNIVNK